MMELYDRPGWWLVENPNHRDAARKVVAGLVSAAALAVVPIAGAANTAPGGVGQYPGGVGQYAHHHTAPGGVGQYHPPHGGSAIKE